MAVCQGGRRGLPGVKSLGAFSEVRVSWEEESRLLLLVGVRSLPPDPVTSLLQSSSSYSSGGHEPIRGGGGGMT